MAISCFWSQCCYFWWSIRKRFEWAVATRVLYVTDARLVCRVLEWMLNLLRLPSLPSLYTCYNVSLYLPNVPEQLILFWHTERMILPNKSNIGNRCWTNGAAITGLLQIFSGNNLGRSAGFSSGDICLVHGQVLPEIMDVMRACWGCYIRKTLIQSANNSQFDGSNTVPSSSGWNVAYCDAGDSVFFES